MAYQLQKINVVVFLFLGEFLFIFLLLVYSVYYNSPMSSQTQENKCFLFFCFLGGNFCLFSCCWFIMFTITLLCLVKPEKINVLFFLFFWGGIFVYLPAVISFLLCHVKPEKINVGQSKVYIIDHYLYYSLMAYEP